VTKTTISEFREAVYQKVICRPAVLLDLVDALTIAGQVNSPVALSESPLFRRKFSSVYDALVHGELGDDLKTLFSDRQDADWERIAGYEIHAIDATPHERMSAETLADRGVLKAQQKEAVYYGHKSSWLVRLVQSGTSWVAPEDIERIGTATTDTKVAAQQVKDLAVRNPRPKVITADSRYRDRHFLGAFADLENTYALVRLQNNQKPDPKPEGSRGAPVNPKRKSHPFRSASKPDLRVSPHPAPQQISSCHEYCEQLKCPQLSFGRGSDDGEAANFRRRFSRPVTVAGYGQLPEHHLL
jgi:hypothetical protein